MDHAPGQIAIRACNLTHRFGPRTALDNVSLDVPASCIFGVLGPNGSGKTTLFHILATSLIPTEGDARVDGASVLTDRMHARRRIGVVFQMPSLDRKLTVRENLIHQGHLYGLRGPDLRRRADQWLERFGVADRAHDRVEHLSGGLQRRVEIAKALLHQPSVLILDEPSTGIDPSARLTLMRHLRELKESHGVTCLLTTHLMDEADQCDRILLLDAGRVVADDTPERLKSMIGGDVLILRSRDASSLADAIRSRWNCNIEVVDDCVHVECDRGADRVAELASAFPGRFESIAVGKPTLHDVFLHLTGKAFEPAPGEITTHRASGSLETARRHERAAY